jgi:prophage DNA circulation protein
MALPPKPQKAGAGTPASPPTYEQFLDEFTFRGIAIPVVHVETSFSQSIVEHKPVDRDGAFVETTGRDPYRVSVTAVFSNHLHPGESSTWEFGKLYPFQYDKVLAAIRDRSLGKLKHPRWGVFDAKPVSWKESIDPMQRSGVTLSIEFVESIKPTFDTTSSSISATASAAAYDQAITVLIAKGLPVPPDLDSFQDLVNQIKGFIDSGAMFATLALAKINRVLYNIDRLAYSFKSAKDNVTADAQCKGERLYENVIAMQQAVNRSLGAVHTTRLRRATTMAGLVARYGNDLGMLVSLNPHLVNSPPVIPEGTVIRYRTI